MSDNRLVQQYKELIKELKLENLIERMSDNDIAEALRSMSKKINHKLESKVTKNHND